MIQTITAATHKTQNELCSFQAAQLRFCAEGKLYNSLQVYYTCYRLGACVAPLGEELGEAVRAVGELLPRGEPLARQRLGAVGAGEALSVPGVVSISHPACCDHLGMEFV